MIQIEQRGKNLAPFISPNNYLLNHGTIYNGYAFLSNANGTANLDSHAITIEGGKTYTFSAKIPSGYTAGVDYALKLWEYNDSALIHVTQGGNPFTFTLSSEINKIVLEIWVVNKISAVISQIQLEEGSVATPYEDPWVNMLNFDDNLHAGEFLQKSKGIFYIHKTWYRDEQNNPYEQLTFTNGVATPSAITSEPVIVEDINTGEIKNAMVSGSAVNVYLNQYDSWDVTNSTTTAFTLSKTSLTIDYPVAINGTVTTSGFTLTNTQITFDNAVASGSSVSCVYPYLDTSYNSDAKVFYQVSQSDEQIMPEETKNYTLLSHDDVQVTTTSTTPTTVKSVRIDTASTNINKIDVSVGIWNSSSSASTTLDFKVDGTTKYTTSSSSTTETILRLPSLNISKDIHTIEFDISTSLANTNAYMQYMQIMGS